MRDDSESVDHKVSRVLSFFSVGIGIHPPPHTQASAYPPPLVRGEGGGGVLIPTSARGHTRVLYNLFTVYMHCTVLCTVHVCQRKDRNPLYSVQPHSLIVSLNKVL